MVIPMNSNNLSPSALILVGMPGAGKSTLGVVLAKKLGWAFLDTDLQIQQKEGRLLQEILDLEGYQALRAAEERVLLGLPTQAPQGIRGRVIATGGSAVYSEAGMAYLLGLGPVVHLEADLETLRSRVQDWDQRGIARPPGQSLEELMTERSTLYRRYAHTTLDTRGRTLEDAAQEIMEWLLS